MRSRAEVPRSVLQFVPLFCPNEACVHHGDFREPGSYQAFQRRGVARIRRRPGWVRCFVCTACGRWFRSSVFFDVYWTKIPDLSAKLFLKVINGMGYRQISREHGVGLNTVRWRIRRMAERALLAHLAQLHLLKGRLPDAVVFDGERTFAGSLNEPLDLHTAAMVHSGFFLDCNIAPLRRSGRMTPGQRRRREERDRRLGRPDPLARRRQTTEILRRLLELVPAGQKLQLRTDKEPAYAQAVARVGGAARIDHSPTSSKKRRDGANPLWRINCLHRYMRHGDRNLTRETMAFPKTAAGLWDRVWIFVLGQNNHKGINEQRRAGRNTTPAMVLGLQQRRQDWKGMCGVRRFKLHIGLPEELRAAYEGSFRARPNENVKPYRPKFVA